MEQQQMPMAPSMENAKPLSGSILPERKRHPFRKFFSWLIALFIVAVAVWVLFGSVFSYSKGFREGYIYKFSKKGVIFKTWEGTLKTGFISFNNTSTPNEEWKFSVKDPAVADDLNKLGERVFLKLYYTQYFFRLPWRGDTKYFITKVEKEETR